MRDPDFMIDIDDEDVAGLQWDAGQDLDSAVPLIPGRDSIRKLRLLACALIRHVPFHRDGRTIWDLLPTFDWYSTWTRRGNVWTCRELVEAAERRADGMLSDEEWLDMQDVAMSATWSAEADTFGYDPDRYPGSNFRYAAANAVRQVAFDERATLAESMFHYLWYMKFDRDSNRLIHPENRDRGRELTFEFLGDPARPATFKRRWESGGVLCLASKINEQANYALMPALGKALQSAGCRDEEILGHCRPARFHTKGCWLIDDILGKT